MGQNSGEARGALVKFLIRAKLLPESALDAPYLLAESEPVTFFQRRGELDEAAAVRALSDELNIPQLLEDELRRVNSGELLHHPKLAAIPLSDWRSLRIAPLSIHEGTIRVAFANPLDISVRQRLSFEFSARIEPVIATERQIEELLHRVAPVEGGYSLREIVQSSGVRDGEAETSRAPANIETTEQVDVEAPPVIQLVNRLFVEAISARASDIHLTPTNEELLVRVRVDGIMRKLFSVPRLLQSSTVSRIKLLSGMDIAERRKPQDGRFRLKAADGVFDVRVSTVPTPHGENVVGRLLRSELGIVNFEQLGMEPEVESRFCDALRASSRILLITGPTGSGKSSTVYASLLKLHDGTRNIVTIEDPIEYRIPGITQIQVNRKAGMDFAAILKSVLRQDPDVIMVGEIRDVETAQLAVQAAQTGHLVLSTLHTESAPAAVTRLLDLGVPGYAIAASLGSVLAQRLVRKLCATCSPQTEAGRVSEVAHVAKGCSDCQGEGYRGRVGIFSLLSVGPSLQEAIRRGATEQEIVRLAEKDGFEHLRDSARKLIASGKTTEVAVEEVLGPVPLDTSATTHVVSEDVEEQPHETSNLKRRRILLVEDDEDTRHVMRLLLEREFYEVIDAENGREGLARLYEVIPDAIICDLMMPEMDGREFLRRLQQDSRTQKIPILMLTAADTEANELDSLGGGARDFLGKGSDSRILLARLEKLLSVLS